MAARPRSNGYSARARLVAIFVALALVLGGGGSPNPLTEVIVELCFVVVAMCWLWLPGSKASGLGRPVDRLALVLALVPLLVPLVQLIPLPPPVWTALPGRGDEVAALSLIGEQHSWRAISMSPNRTVAGVLAIVPAAFCLVAVAQLDKHERRLVLATVAMMVVASAMLGALQLVARGARINFYEQFSRGWVTGFQANRNAEADVLLIGFMALIALAAPYLVGNRRRLLLNLNLRMYALLVGSVGLLLLLATVMTGSRAGTTLILFACAAAFAIIIVERRRTAESNRPKTIVPIGFAVIAPVAVVFMAVSGNTALERVAGRFSDLGSERTEIWQDTRFAIAKSWPVGVGIGGFEPAMLSAERLEVLDPEVPNRAHNDYLEIGLEAGVFGYLEIGLIVILCMTMAWRTWRDRRDVRGQIVFGASVLLLIAFHSVVDYPLRSMAIACLAGVAGGMLARTRVPVA